MRPVLIMGLIGAVMMTGCAAPPSAIEPPAAEPPVADGTGAEPIAARPADLPFPEYLYPQGYEIGQYGRIPETQRMAAEFRTDDALAQVLDSYSDLLVSRGWKIGKFESLPQSFRLTAATTNAWLELRAVQGTGPSSIFLMYQQTDSGTLPESADRQDR